MAADYIIKTKLIAAHDRPSIKWCLDSPKNEAQVSFEKLNNEGLLFRGWLLLSIKEEVEVCVLSGDQTFIVDFNENRPDVMRKVLTEADDREQSLRCGFKVKLPLTNESFTVGFKHKGTFFPLLEGKVEVVLKVLKGEQEWLFLDNDSNNSVEQFTGKLLLSWTDKKQWKAYFNNILKLSTKLSLTTAMLVAPSKEMVYSEQYPHKRARKTPINQLLKIVPKNFKIIYPTETLINMEQRSFRICDTHWTLHGAREASIMLASTLTGVDISEKRLFENDVYKQKETSGDLGNKLFPPQKCQEDYLSNYNYRKVAKFDNQLANIGRVIIFYNQTALFDKRLLIFGSSSAYTMFNYLTRIFQNVLFIHTAGNVDPEVIDVVKPDFLCTQTNARFVVRPPAVGVSLKEYIGEKIRQTPAVHRKPIRIAKFIPDGLSDDIAYFSGIHRELEKL